MACSLGASTSVQAQFWKKVFKKKQQTETTNDIEKEKEEESTSVIKGIFKKKQRIPDFPKTAKKERYRIDVLIPLNLNTLVKDGKAVNKNLPEGMKPNINFYEGLKMAADSLNTLNQNNLDIYIHDITDPLHSIASLTSSNALLESDLIIGYLQSNELGQITQFSKDNNINFLSALSPSDAGIVENPYFILLQPTLSTHISKLVDFALKRNRTNPKFLFYLDNTPIQKEAFNQLEESLEKEDYISIDCAKLMFNKDSLMTILDSTKTNVVFINILSLSAVDPIMKVLQELSPKYVLEIYGMPSWKALQGLNSKDGFPGLHIFYTNPFYFEPNSGPGIAISQKYKTHYGGKPSELVYRGFESLYWMSDLLDKYGNIFNEHFNDVRASPFTRYAIKPVFNKANTFQYFENQNLYIFHFHNGYFNTEK